MIVEIGKKRMAKHEVWYSVTNHGELWRLETGKLYRFLHGIWEHKGWTEIYDPVVFKTKSESRARICAARLCMKELCDFVVEDLPLGFKDKKNDYYEEGDEKHPFTSEGFMYPLLGKEDARSVRARIRQLRDAIGMDGMEEW